MVDHTHIAGIHDVCTLFVLKNREILARTLFLHQRILIPARLRARAAVGVAPGHVVAEQAAPGIGHTHGAVAEGLDLKLRRRFFTDLTDLRKGKLPREDDALRTEVIPRLRAGVIADGLLRRNVTLAVRRVLPGHGEHAKIREDQRIHARRIQRTQILRQLRSLVVARHRIDRRVDADAVAVRKAHSLRQLLRSKISRKGTHTKARSRQIDGVRTVQHGHFQLFHIAGRTKQLRFLLHVNAPFLQGLPGAHSTSQRRYARRSC